MTLFTRRSLLGALTLPWLAGCSTPLPLSAAPPSVADDGASRLLRASAEAHGLASFRGLHDINVGYSGQWRPLIGGIQPEIVDAGYRVSSQERLLVREGVYGQDYEGPSGHKLVLRTRGAAPPGGARSMAKPALGDVAVWRNGTPSRVAADAAAAALVADGYVLFLLGPLWLADAALPMTLAGRERVDGVDCDVVQVWLAPGLGLVAADRIALCIDPRSGLMRRVRFTLEGFAGTRGAVAEVDTYDHERRFGVVWPMRSYERVVHPLALPAHDWHITGIDVDRGYTAADLEGPAFRGRAAANAG